MKSFFFLLILSFSVPAIAMADSVEPLDRQFIKSMNEEQRKTRMLLLEQRLDEIKELPRKEMNRDQRKALKKEVKDIKKEMRQLAQGAGIYISGSALVIILLLLLLL